MREADGAEDPGEDAGTYDLVISNPPYIRADSRLVSKDQMKAVARHEVEGGLSDFLSAGAALLKDKGHLCLIHRPARLADIMTEARRFRLEPKVLRMVTPRAGEAANLVLLDLRKGAGAELAILPELVVYGDGGYSEEILRIYEREA